MSTPLKGPCLQIRFNRDSVYCETPHKDSIKDYMNVGRGNTGDDYKPIPSGIILIQQETPVNLNT